MIYAVIMAGGTGTRFWPQSTKDFPKQFLNLFGRESMIQNTARRIEDLIPQERILVVTNENYVSIVKNQLPQVPVENIVGEPVAKNTAPCVAIAAELLFKKDPEAIMVVLPADHHITKPEEFKKYLKTAIEKAESGKHLVTIGVEPSRPETGYGYIHAQKGSEESFSGNIVHPVIEFTEKPDDETAKHFVKSGEYFWNSGMFIWKAETVLDEFKEHLPEMYKQVKLASAGLYGKNHNEAIRQFYFASQSISIDYGIMEQSKSVFVVPGEFGWNDVGSWTAVYELADKDENHNAIQAKNAIFTEAYNNLVLSKSNKMISIVGFDNVAVVETEDAILVCNLEKAQGVKQIVEQLKAEEELHKFL